MKSQNTGSTPRMILVVVSIIFIALMFSLGISKEIPTGTISGRVAAFEDGSPVANAKVYHPARDSYVKTDADGNYILFGVPESEKGYEIRAYAKGFEYSTYSNVKVSEGKYTENIDFRMVRRKSYYSLYAYQKVFMPGEKPVININGYLVKKINTKVYKVNPHSYMRNLLEYDGISQINMEDKTPVYEEVLTNTFNDDGDFNRTVSLPLTEEGVYVVETEAVGGSLTKTTWVMVTPIGLIVKRSPQEVLVYAEDFRTGKPLPDVTISAYRYNNLYVSGNTGSEGLYQFDNQDEQPLQITASQGDSFAFAHTYYGRTSDKSKMYLYTDRPVYRPGQTVFFKGIHRLRQGSGYQIHRGAPVDVVISDSRGTKIYENRLYTGGFGSFADSIVLDEVPPLGSYSLIASSGNDSAYYYFDVSEYRKPEYKIEVKTEKEHYIAGDRITVNIQGQYYFGAPVANTPFSVTVLENAYRWNRLNWDDYYQGSYEAHGGIMFEAKGMLDEKGNAQIFIPTGKISHDKLLTIEVEAVDISGRAVLGETYVPLSVGEFALNAYTDRYVYDPQDKINIHIETIDYNNKPVAQQPVTVRMKYVTYEEVEETVESFGGSRHTEFRVKRIENPIGGAVTKTTDEEGKTLLEFTPPKEGTYSYSVSSKDQRGNTVEYENEVYVAGLGFSGYMGQADLNIITDKKNYNKNDTIKAVITTTGKDCYVLLTVEGRKIYKKQLVYIKQGAASVDIPLKDEYFPNIFLSVAAIIDMDLVTNSKEIRMSREEKKLNIAIETHKKKYKPGETAVYSVLVTDNDGKPVEAELSLGVVDEAVYAIKPDNTPDIHNYFWEYDYNQVDTTFSFMRDYSGGADKYRPDRIRKNFKDTAYWNPFIITGADGKAEVEFEMPDNLTTWVGTVRAVDTYTHVGSVVNFTLCTKDLLVRLETPRFLTQRDEIKIGGIVHNYTEIPQNVRVWLEAEGVDLKDTQEFNAEINPGDAKDFYWSIEADKPGEAVFTLLCMGTDAEDAMELTLPVLPFGVEEVEIKSGLMGKDENSVSLSFNLPEKVTPETVQLEALLSPSIASSLVDNLHYLVSYPYGCVEQTMSSFGPAISADRILKKLGIQDKVLEEEVPTAIQRGLNRLYDMQHYDGGWGWWKNDSTHPYMTAYVVMGLKEAQRSGYQVNNYCLKRGIEALTKMIQNPPEPVKSGGGVVQQGEEWNMRIYILYSLYTTGNVHMPKILEVFENRKTLSEYGLALLALTLDGGGEIEKAKLVLQELDQKAVETESDCYWDGRTFNYTWMDNRTETTAFCLQAYAQIVPYDKKIGKIINWLLKDRQGPGYHSTKDTAAVVHAFVNYLMKSGELDPDYIMTAGINNQQIVKHQADSYSFPESVNRLKLGAADLLNGANRFNLSKEGKGLLYYTASLRYFLNQDTIEPLNRGIKVNREYFILTRDKNNKGDIVEITTPLGDTPIQRGGRLRVEVTVEADNDYQYVIIEDPLPAGFEATVPEGERNWGSLWWCQQEIRDEKVSFFTRRLEKGKKMKLSYDIRSEMFGVVRSLPVLAYPMYDPAVRGHSSENKLRVTE